MIASYVLVPLEQDQTVKPFGYYSAAEFALSSASYQVFDYPSIDISDCDQFEAVPMILADVSK